MNWQNFDYGKWQKEDSEYDHAKFDAAFQAACEAAETIADLPELTKDIPRPPWKPEPFYNVAGDGFELYLADDVATHTKWLCPGVEVMLSLETDEVVGINIWDVKGRIAKAEAESKTEKKIRVV